MVAIPKYAGGNRNFAGYAIANKQRTLFLQDIQPWPWCARFITNVESAKRFDLDGVRQAALRIIEQRAAEAQYLRDNPDYRRNVLTDGSNAPLFEDTWCAVAVCASPIREPSVWMHSFYEVSFT